MGLAPENRWWWFPGQALWWIFLLFHRVLCGRCLQVLCFCWCHHRCELNCTARCLPHVLIRAVGLFSVSSVDMMENHSLAILLILFPLFWARLSRLVFSPCSCLWMMVRLDSFRHGPCFLELSLQFAFSVLLLHHLAARIILSAWIEEPSFGSFHTASHCKHSPPAQSPPLYLPSFLPLLHCKNLECDFSLALQILSTWWITECWASHHCCMFSLMTAPLSLCLLIVQFWGELLTG